MLGKIFKKQKQEQETVPKYILQNKSFKNYYEELEYIFSRDTFQIESLAL